MTFGFVDGWQIVLLSARLSGICGNRCRGAIVGAMVDIPTDEEPVAVDLRGREKHAAAAARGVVDGLSVGSGELRHQVADRLRREVLAVLSAGDTSLENVAEDVLAGFPSLR